MGERISTSKKRSGASYTARRASPLQIFLDRCLGDIRLAAELRKLEDIEVYVHKDHFPINAEDVVWIPPVAKNGWIILTKDKGIRHRELEIQAVRANEAYLLNYSKGDYSVEEMAEGFKLAQKRIRRETAKWCAPFFGRITKSGDFEVL